MVIHQASILYLTIFLKGFRDPKKRLDEGLVIADNVISDLTKIINRADYPQVKNVRMITFKPDKLSNSNDHDLKLMFQFETLVIFSTR